jgi:hypothetical protein
MSGFLLVLSFTYSPTLKMVAVRSSETSVKYFPATPLHSEEDTFQSDKYSSSTKE